MAHKDSVQDEELRAWVSNNSFFYNIHQNVGWGYPNQKDDVLLIQYFLNFYLDWYGKTKLVEDGIFGNKTFKAVKFFQKGGFVDGAVNTVNGRKIRSTKSKTIYTMYELNVTYLSMMPNGKLYFKDLRMDPNLPQPLAQALTVL